jgi:hypothetical protein
MTVRLPYQENDLDTKPSLDQSLDKATNMTVLK